VPSGSASQAAPNVATYLKIAQTFFATVAAKPGLSDFEARHAANVFHCGEGGIFPQFAGPRQRRREPAIPFGISRRWRDALGRAARPMFFIAMPFG